MDNDVRPPPELPTKRYYVFLDGQIALDRHYMPEPIRPHPSWKVRRPPVDRKNDPVGISPEQQVPANEPRRARHQETHYRFASSALAIARATASCPAGVRWMKLTAKE